MTQLERLFYNYTPAALEDELTFLLSSKNEAEVIVDEEDRQHIQIFHPYLNQSEALLYRINVYDPLPEFVIWTEDIPEGLVQALKSQGKAAMETIILDAVRRIYESVDPRYFHTNSIDGKVKWRFGKRKQ